ncbi:hypothetical protein LP52_09655 [Streptomonospora alba]|uniref:DUF397 domain-containing protein n=1 Tax=Streptomonospora alba TaxID=183763 RepID=A0A0C2JJK0_9ACTN|nr:DUF397 domain-containing protein [Streptomonospora alba]KIH99100.1 hypothetical protein LP52_09655 [Streptomonospora alba]
MKLNDSGWRKSSYSGNQGGDCVEVADTRHQVHVRDTRNRELGHLSFPAASWNAFIAALKDDRLTG